MLDTLIPHKVFPCFIFSQTPNIETSGVIFHIAEGHFPAIILLNTYCKIVLRNAVRNYPHNLNRQHAEEKPLDHFPLQNEDSSS